MKSVVFTWHNCKLWLIWYESVPQSQSSEATDENPNMVLSPLDLKMFRRPSLTHQWCPFANEDNAIFGLSSVASLLCDCGTGSYRMSHSLKLCQVNTTLVIKVSHYGTPLFWAPKFRGTWGLRKGFPHKRDQIGQIGNLLMLGLAPQNQEPNGGSKFWWA